MKTVVALYDNHSAAQRAVSELIEHGFSRDDISLLAPNPSGRIEERTLEAVSDGAAQGAGIGAGLGAALGGLGGLLVGLGALTIPGIGPVIAAGPLAAAVSGLAGAGMGAVAGGLTGSVLGALVDMGVPEERAHYYAEGVRRGGTLLIVRTNDDRTRQAVDVVNRHQPVDLNERSALWRQSGWSRFDPDAPVYDLSAEGEKMGMAGMPADDQQRHHDHEHNSPIGMAGSTTDDQAHHHDHEHDNPIGMAGSTTGPLSAGSMDFEGFDRYDPIFRSHFQISPYASNYTYDDYRPAYYYGYQLSRDERYRGSDWATFENDAARDWDSRYPGTWERFKDSVRHAWEELKDALD